MNKEVILCVDDENMVLQSIKNELINIFEHQYVIEVAESGPEALDLFKELLSNDYEIPVIISDYIMPGMKGDEFLKQIHRLAPRAAKIMLTGQAVVEGIANAINEANLFRYLEKPWKKEELKEAICEAFATYHRDKMLEVEQQQLLQAKESLQEELRLKNMELTYIREKLNLARAGAPEDIGAGGRMTENRLLFQEMSDLLERTNAEVDSGIQGFPAALNGPPQGKRPPVIPGAGSGTLNLQEYLTGILNYLKKLAGDGVEFGINCEEIPVLAYCPADDGEFLKYALLNMLTAFIRGIKCAGKIAIHTLLRDQQAIIGFEVWGEESQLNDYVDVFRDDFTPERQDREMVFKFSSSYKIVKEHGGNITVTKNASGAYTFEIRLPGVSIN